VQLADGRLLAFGRGNTIDGRMPRSVSADLAESWTYSASPFPPISGGLPRTVDGGGNTGRFTMSATSAEPRGYLSICQTPDGVIQLISSKQHYAFNLAWLNTRPPVPKEE